MEPVGNIKELNSLSSKTICSLDLTVLNVEKSACPPSEAEPA